MDLPLRIPLFPLPNVVLFPGVPLPLHVFEPRYREMVRDARAGESVIGMVLLKGEWQKDYYGRPSIFDVGCAGRLVSVEPLSDGRSNILLHGIREFQIAREVGDHSYREAEVSWRPTDVSRSLGADRRLRVKGLLERFLSQDKDSPA
ncbi:MAG TPA: LON peptidase substrate-binding domain-containing protein, partial [Candidatus Kryptonia bacterium]|nr:LON peptidase substrate-binding domain-containing protein [Candidatus Kryptonia bacterium]